MAEPNFIAQEEGLNFNSVVEAIIKRSCIIDFGIVQKVITNSIVEVAVAVSRTPQSMLCMTCVLANTAGTSLTVSIKPNEGDRVLVVYPRTFHSKMFNVDSDEAKRKEVLIDFDAKGYNLASGIAILMNQYKKSGHKNIITVEDGEVDVKLAYSKDDDKNMFSFSVDKHGAFTIKNDKATITVDKDGSISAGNDKGTLEIDKQGAFTVSNDKATATIDKDGNVSIDAKGKYTIKNNSTDLMKVIDELAKAVEQLTTTGSSTTQSASPATVAQVGLWRTSQLNQLFASLTPAP